MAKAQQGKTYAQVLNGKCNWIFTVADLPEWNDSSITVVDVTGQVVNVGDSYDGATFHAPVVDLAQLKAAQLSVISSACAAAIVGGFKSSALGNAYTYPSNETDQINLSGSVMSSLFPNLPANWTTLQVCCDANGNWAYLPHTVAQIQQVGIDFKTFKLNCLTRNATLQAQVTAATTVVAVQAINF